VLDLPPGPVVTVCGVGRTAAIATNLLRANGVEALTLDGGMRSWSSPGTRPNKDLRLPGRPGQEDWKGLPLYIGISVRGDRHRRFGRS